MKRGLPIPWKVKEQVCARSRNYCEARLEQYRCVGYLGPDWRDGDYHHRRSRARGGSHTAENLIRICRNCHHAIEIHRPGTEKWRTHSWQPEGTAENE